MAAVLFLVVIPTEAEELRLKNEFINRKVELRSENNSQQHVKLANTTPTLTGSYEVLIEPETISEATTTELNSTGAASVRYGTFPKRHKHEAAANKEPTSEQNTITKSQNSLSAENSIKDSDIDSNTVSSIVPNPFPKSA